MGAKQPKKFKVLMFPWLAHGHIFPFLELSKRLSKKNFHIYFCSTPLNLDSIEKTLKNYMHASSSPGDHDFSIELVQLHMPSLPELPPHYHTTKNVPPHLMPTLLRAFQMSKPAFSDIIKNLNPDLLIYDAFQPWSAKIASSQGIASVLFAISGSTACSFYHHLHTHKSFDSFPFSSIYLTDYEKRDLISQGESIQVEDVDEGFAFGVFKLSHEIALIKSCRGFEGKYMDYLSSLCHKKIVPVGPLVTYGGNQENDSSDGPEMTIMDWLSMNPQFSTLYISFGSENYLSKHQIGEIAKGLEISNVNFIWAARLPHGSGIVMEEALPEGFLDRLKTRWKIVEGWAPQAAILAHPSVGGFMSHYGWSSVTESVYFGVPVVALPLKLDQPVNCRLAVDVGLAVEVLRAENGEIDGEGIAEAVRKVIVEESGDRLRRRARELSERMKMEDKDAICGVDEELTRICMSSTSIGA